MKTIQKKKYHQILILILLTCSVLSSALSGCIRKTDQVGGIGIEEESISPQASVQVTDDSNLAEAQSDNNGAIARSTLVVDYIFYSTNPDETYDIPLTFSRNGKTYEFTGEVDYAVSGPYQGIAHYQEVTVEEQEDVDPSFLFTSPETGQTYTLHRSTIQFSEEIPVEITLKAAVNFGPGKNRPDIPDFKEITYYNKITKMDETVLAPLSSKNNSEDYWLEADEPIRGTFRTDRYGLNTWIIGWEEDENRSTPEHKEYTPYKIPLDFQNSATPSWDGYDQDILKWLNLDPKQYRITAAGWENEIYETMEYQEGWDRDIVVACRDAYYPYEVLVKDYSATYETSVQTLGYEAKVWYFSDEVELEKSAIQKKKKGFEEKLEQDICTLYQITASATYRYEETLTGQADTDNAFLVPSCSPVPNQQSRLDDLQEINPDVFGIIEIPDTILNHPLMRCEEDEDFYLRKNLAGEKDISGIPFLTLDSTFNAPASNSIIYGHNIHKSKRDVFCDLAGYEDIDYYLEHPIIQITTKEGCFDYVIFAYYLVDASDLKNPFPYWETTKFPSVKSFLAYMEEVKKRNWLDLPLDLTRSDSYITLSSCALEQNKTKTNRMVVMARKVREGENIPDKIKQAAKANSPLLPVCLQKENHCRD